MEKEARDRALVLTNLVGSCVLLLIIGGEIVWAIRTGDWPAGFLLAVAFPLGVVSLEQALDRYRGEADE